MADRKEFTDAVRGEFEKMFLSLGAAALEKLSTTFNEKAGSGRGESDNEEKLKQLRKDQTDAEVKTKQANEKFESLSPEIRTRRAELEGLNRRIAESRPLAEKYESVIAKHRAELLSLGV